MLTVSGETKKKRQRSGRSGARLHIFCGRAAHEDMGMLYTYSKAVVHARTVRHEFERGKGCDTIELHDLVVIMSIT